MKFFRFFFIFFCILSLGIAALGSLIDIYKNRHTIKLTLERIFTLNSRLFIHLNAVNPIVNEKSSLVISRLKHYAQIF